MSASHVRAANPVAVAKEAVELCMARGATAADARVVRLAQEQLEVQDGRTSPKRTLRRTRPRVCACLEGRRRGLLPPRRARRATPSRTRPGRAPRAGGRAGRGACGAFVQLAGDASASGEYHTEIREDPFLVPLEEKIDLLTRTDSALSGRREIVARVGGDRSSPGGAMEA